MGEVRLKSDQNDKCIFWFKVFYFDEDDWKYDLI